MGAVEEIKERIDIVEFISSYVNLQKAGRNYKGNCPFHSEKTPSFVVFPETQGWHCFGACNTGGDIFSFLMKKEGLSFKEALAELAGRAGVSLAPPAPQDVERDKLRARLLDIHAAATLYFHNLLLRSEGAQKARDYLEGRGLGRETVEGFQLGYSLDSWDGLMGYMTGRGYEVKELVEAGLAVHNEERGTTYDRFRDRLMIPIRDANGKVVGFGARALDPDAVPKYLNSPQTHIFDKGSILFGMDMAKRAMREEDSVIIVEGYMDVMSARQHGVRNVVAQMGTALSEGQVRMLSRHTRNLVLALDPDTAGRMATLRDIDVARSSLETEVPVLDPLGFVRHESSLDADIRVMTLPEGKDPDDILREEPHLWRELVEGALPLVDFYFDATARSVDLNTSKGKREAVGRLIPIIREIKSEVERMDYLQKLSRLLRIPERSLLAELERKRRAPGPSKTVTGIPPAAVEEGFAFGTEEYCLSLVIGHPSSLPAANSQLREIDMSPLGDEDFSEIENRLIFEAVVSWAQKDSPAETTLTALYDTVDKVLLPKVFFLWDRWDSASTFAPEEKLDNDLVNRVLGRRKSRIKEEIEALRFLQMEADDSGDEEMLASYTDMVDSAREELRTIEKVLDARSIMGQRRQEERGRH